MLPNIELVRRWYALLPGLGETDPNDDSAFLDRMFRDYLDEDYELSPEGAIDIEPMLRDAVVLTMPFSPRCRPDCKGLCPRCGGDRNLGECACTPDTDPRWDALMSIEFPDETT